MAEDRHHELKARDFRVLKGMRKHDKASLVPAVLHQSPDKRGVPLPVKMVSQLTQTWHSQIRSFC